VFAEANSFGLPVITTEVGGIPTVIRNGVNGMMFPLEAPPEDYSRWIAELFFDRIRNAALVRNSFEEYQKRLNWRVAGDTVMRYLETLQGLGRGG
jgi:glycosyltransferase involved in cell wall biosynthesis